MQSHTQEKSKKIWKVFHFFKITHLCQSICCNHSYFLKHRGRILSFTCAFLQMKGTAFCQQKLQAGKCSQFHKKTKMSRAIFMEICVCKSIDTGRLHTAFSKSTSWIWESFSQEEEMCHEKQVTSHTERAADGASMKQLQPPRAWSVLQAEMCLPC